MTEQRVKVDGTLEQRRAARELVWRLKDENLTLQQMEEIGARLKRFGNRALTPVFRELGREEDAELISRYAYILDYFEEEDWIDRLAQLALQRRHMAEGGRVALLTALQGYGVDVEVPPFSALLPGQERQLQHSLSSFPGLDDAALVSLMDDFLGYPVEMQVHVIRELPKSGEPEVASLLEALLWHEETAVVEAALTALGRVRSPLAAQVLMGYLRDGDPAFADKARYSLRRLALLGIEAPAAAELLPYHAAYASAPDGDGYRSLLICRWVEKGKLAALYLQVHERRGLLAAWGGEGSDLEVFEEEVEAFRGQEEMYPVEPGFVLELVRDALYWSRDLCYLPADFYLRRGIFRGEDLTPAVYRPSFEAAERGRTLTYREGEAIATELLADPFFAGWVLAHRRVYDFAQEYREGESQDQVIERLCGELLTPQVDLIRERILATADLMQRCGRQPGFVRKVVALAASLEGYQLPYHLHPFLRRFAVESMDLATDALEGEKELGAVLGSEI